MHSLLALSLTHYLFVVRVVCVYLPSGVDVGAGVVVASGVDVGAGVVVSFLYRKKFKQSRYKRYLSYVSTLCV